MLSYFYFLFFIFKLKPLPIDLCLEFKSEKENPQCMEVILLYMSNVVEIYLPKKGKRKWMGLRWNCNMKEREDRLMICLTSCHLSGSMRLELEFQLKYWR